MLLCSDSYVMFLHRWSQVAAASAVWSAKHSACPQCPRSRWGQDWWHGSGCIWQHTGAYLYLFYSLLLTLISLLYLLSHSVRNKSQCKHMGLGYFWKFNPVTDWCSRNQISIKMSSISKMMCSCICCADAGGVPLREGGRTDRFHCGSRLLGDGQSSPPTHNSRFRLCATTKRFVPEPLQSQQVTANMQSDQFAMTDEWAITDQDDAAVIFLMSDIYNKKQSMTLFALNLWRIFLHFCVSVIVLDLLFIKRCIVLCRQAKQTGYSETEVLSQLVSVFWMMKWGENVCFLPARRQTHGCSQSLTIPLQEKYLSYLEYCSWCSIHWQLPVIWNLVFFNV